MFASVFLLLSLCLPLFFTLLPCFYPLALSFVLVSLCLRSFVLLLSFACSLVLSLLFLFPLRTMREKKGRKVFLRPLLSCCELVLDVLKHYRYLLRFFVAISLTFANDSCNIFRSFRWVVYCLPALVNCRISPVI